MRVLLTEPTPAPVETRHPHDGPRPACGHCRANRSVLPQPATEYGSDLWRWVSVCCGWESPAYRMRRV